MISIELWRARIGLYNCKRFSRTLSSLFSSSCCNHIYYQNRKRWKILLDNNPNGDSATRDRSSLSCLFSSSLRRPLVLVLLVTAVILITSSINSRLATSDRPMIELLVDPHGSSHSVSSSAQFQSERFALILFEEIQFVEKHLDSDKKKFFQSFLRDCNWLSRDDNKSSAASCTWDSTNVPVSQNGHDGALVNSTYVRDSCSSAVTHVSRQLLVLSGDVELNPGPKYGVDDKPKMYDLQCMSYTSEDGKATDFRLKERILRNWRNFAYALRFPIHAVESIRPEEDPVDHFLRRWLQGANKTEDPRPITWGTLIAALRHANFQEEVSILEKHFISVDPVFTQPGDCGVPLPTLQQLLESLKDLDNWYLFGAFLGVPVNQLRKIESSHHGEIERYKVDMLQYWVDNTVNASWKEVARALEQADQLVLAIAVKKKHLWLATREKVLSPAIISKSEEWSNVSDALLREDDIIELCAVLTPIEAKWDCFATQLGILPDKTSAIGRKNHYVPTLCLKDVLSTWLKGDYNIQRHGHQSWRRVCEATASPAGGEDRILAHEIAAQHRQSKPEQTKETQQQQQQQHHQQEEELEKMEEKEEEQSSTDSYSKQSSLIQRHIQQQGRLNTLCSLKMLLCGPPETGKTTTMRRLTNQIDCLDPSAPNVPSTVLDKPRTIQLLHKSSVLIADQEAWSFEESNKEQQSSLYSLILNFISNTSSTATNTSSTDHLDQHTTNEGDVTMTTSSEQVHVDQQTIDTNEETQFVEPADWKEVTKKLSEVKDITILHVIDSGGQPECHEILPLLLDGKILSLIFLDLTKKLGDKHPVFFRSENDVKNPIGEFTTGEVLEHILSGISSLKSDSHRSIALLVGTHLDLDEATDEVVLDLDKAVQKSFMSFIKNGIICPADIKGEQRPQRYITTINNMTKDHGDIKRLRKLILQVIDGGFRQKQDVPTGWLLLHLRLCHKYQDRGWCTKEECALIAKSCGIKVVEKEKQDKGKEKEGEDELTQVLYAIHENYGTILYYSCLPNLVICDPNIILLPLKLVFEFVFAYCGPNSHIASHIRETGEIFEKELEEFCFPNTSNLNFPKADVVTLLKHRLILCELVGDEKKYFMPCLLQSSHAVSKEVSKPQDLASLNPAPILFVPQSKSCYDSPSPLGVFSALVVDMSTKSEWDHTKCDVCFRNQMQFDVKHKDSCKTYTVELRHHATYIELRLIRGEKILRPHILATFQQQLLRSLEGLSDKYTHINGITWELGFFCPGSLVEGGHPHPALVKKDMSTDDMTCAFEPRCHDRISNLEEKHLCWFEEHDLSKKDTPDGNKRKLPQLAVTEPTTDGDDNTATTTTVKGTATDDDSTLINADTIKPIGGTVSRQHYDRWMFVVIIAVLAAVFAVILSYCIHSTSITKDHSTSSPSSRCHPIPSVESLILKLPVITSQVDFCICLSLTYNRCQQIVNDFRKSKEQTLEIASEWYMQSADPCWEEFVVALICHSNTREARLIADDTGVNWEPFQKCINEGKQLKQCLVL